MWYFENGFKKEKHYNSLERRGLCHLIRVTKDVWKAWENNASTPNSDKTKGLGGGENDKTLEVASKVKF